MTERISIRKFGPIQEADIEVRDLTIFVGPQATGKSMAAQLLYCMSCIEELLTYNTSPTKATSADSNMGGKFETRATQDVITALEWWLGNLTNVYAATGSRIGWQEHGRETADEIIWSENKVSLNFYLEERIHTFAKKENEQKPPHLYVPAGRSLYSFLSPAMVANLFSRGANRLEWPGYIITFYQMLEGVIRSLWDYQQRERKNESLLLDFPLDPFIKNRIPEILKGNMEYGPGTVALTSKDFTLRPETIAAGQMEAWPFLAVIESIAHDGYLENVRIYFEEPEAHLHPKAQQKMMEIVAALVRGGTRVVITTHSPYILYALNNFLTVGEVLSKGRTLPPDIPHEIALLPQQVAAYCFGNNGQISDIMDREVGLIDTQELSRVAEELGSDFTAMQEQLLDGETDHDA